MLSKKQNRKSWGNLNISLIPFSSSLPLRITATRQQAQQGWAAGWNSTMRVWKEPPVVAQSLLLKTVVFSQRCRGTAAAVRDPQEEGFHFSEHALLEKTLEKTYSVSVAQAHPPSAAKCQALASAKHLAALKWQPSAAKRHQQPSPQLTARVCRFLTLFSKLLWAAAAHEPRIVATL